ncbi:AAA family ATPase [Streptomyces mirabilis]|uniref:AAA family ATPase n=1 Tax=Streptomyces mirabilis TaxID=68239 RepID=UPI0036820EE8
MNGLSLRDDARHGPVDVAGGAECGAGEREDAPVGRDRECRLLAELLESLPDRGAALLLRGEAGIGKTTLLEHTARCARTRVLRARGLESESVLPYAVLAELLLPLRAFFTALPAGRRTALEACFALVEAGETNPYAVCAAALGVLAAAGEAEPLVVLVDDLHWADPSSRQVLQFVARRLATERVALVMTLRTGPDEDGVWEGVPCITLTPLDEADCRLLLARTGAPPDAPALARLVRLSRGNPLVLIECAAALARSPDTGDPFGDTPWQAPGPLVERAWRGRLRALSGGARLALVYVAACRTPELPLLERALRVEGLTPDVLDEAEDAGLVRSVEGGYELRHPVMRPLVLARCPAVRRLRAYRTLARLTTGEQRIWYLASAAPGPDETVAAALAEEAARCRDRGALGAAAHAWHRAARLSPDRADRARRLLNAARDAFYGGATREAADWCEQALSCGPDDTLRADIELLRGQARSWLGDPAQAHRGLIAAAAAVEPADGTRACALYAAATMPAALDGRITEAVETATRAVRLAEELRTRAPGTTRMSAPEAPDAAAPPPDPTLRNAQAVQGGALALVGRIADARALLLAGHAALYSGRPVEDQHVVVQIGQALSWVGERDSARDVLGAVIDRARRDGTPGLLPYALVGRCEVASWSHWPMARADGSEALRWAQELGHRSITGYALTLLARLDGLCGDRAGCEERVSDYERYCGHSVRCLEILADAALGSAALAAGDPQACRTHLERALALADAMELGNPNMLPFLTELAEARLRTGDRGGTARLAARLARWARTTGLAWPMAAHAQCRILLADSADEAQHWLAAAEQAHTGQELIFELARSRLAGGQALRRLRRPAAAREPLLKAQLTFAGLGAVPWRDRAAAELSAAGHTGGPARPPELAVAGLTAQELQVALAIGDGMSNCEAAAALFVSRKTVEAHLTRVYRKLGVRSRSELARNLVRAGVVP